MALCTEGGREGGREVGWLVGSAVSPGRVFPFLSGAGPSPLYHGGEPALFPKVMVRVEVLVIVPLERVYPVRASATQAQKAASGGPEYLSVAAGWLAAQHYAGLFAWRPLASRLRTGESY